MYASAWSPVSIIVCKLVHFFTQCCLHIKCAKHIHSVELSAECVWAPQHTKVQLRSYPASMHQCRHLHHSTNHRQLMLCLCFCIPAGNCNATLTQACREEIPMHARSLPISALDCILNLKHVHSTTAVNCSASYGAAAASIPEPDSPWLAYVCLQQLSQCSIHVSHVSEQWLTKLQLSILSLVLATSSLLTLSRCWGYPLYAGAVCCVQHVFPR